MLASIRDLSRLENVAETLRHALKQLAVEAPDWLRVHTDVAWVKRYGMRITEYRLPQADADRQTLVQFIGQDGYRLLEAIHHDGNPT